MTEIVKKSASIILEEINKAKSILLHCHPSPDPDSVGSALAMKFALESLGKKVTLIQGDNEIPKAFEFPGVETIVKKSYGEINTADYDLFISQDASSKGMISFLKEVIFPENMKVIVIDHHASNVGYGHINCIDASYPATAQMIFDLLKEMNIKITHDIALNLFMGIYTDTGGFQYGNTDHKTFDIVSELTELAPEFAKTIFIMNNSKSKSALIFDGLAISSITEYYNGILVIASVNFDQITKNNINKEEIYSSNISNEIKSVEGYYIGACMIETEQNIVKVSFRTRDENKYDVSRLAVALGGGGHKAAAGVRLNMTMNEAINKVVETTKIIYNL